MHISWKQALNFAESHHACGATLPSFTPVLSIYAVAQEAIFRRANPSWPLLLAFQAARQKAGETESRNPDLLQQFLCSKSYLKRLSWMLRGGLKNRLKWECNFVLSYNAAKLRNNGKEMNLDTLYHTENCSKL